MAIEKELLDQLLEGRDPETVFTQDGLLDELKKGLSERVLNAELDAHLDAETADGKTNRHNGRSQKTVLTGTSKVTLDIPRDRVGTFDPQLIAKYQRRFPDFDEKIISMYARGMTVREALGALRTFPTYGYGTQFLLQQRENTERATSLTNGLSALRQGHLGFAQHADNLFRGVAFTAHFILFSMGQNAPNSLNKSGPLLGGHSTAHRRPATGTQRMPSPCARLR